MNTMTKAIDLPAARVLLARAVETQGREFVYNPAGSVGGCINVPYSDDLGGLPAMPDNSPKRKTGCLVGTAMKLSGEVPDSIFPRMGSVCGFKPWLTTNAERYLRIAQQHQDGGSSWGHAYDSAEMFAARHLEEP